MSKHVRRDTVVEDHMREGLSKHTLELHVDAPKLRAYYLRPPKGGRMMSTYVVFTVEGIVILGDLCPKQNGVISMLGYGIDWFASRLSEDYLCSKFLRTEWIPEKGFHQLKADIIQGRRDDAIEKQSARNAFDTLEWIDSTELSSEKAHEIFHEAGLSDFELGYGYNPGDAGWLCAIQQRFSELYWAGRNEERMGTFAAKLAGVA